MKRIAVVILSFIFLLSGCAGTKPVSSKTEQYIVSALGFDFDNGFKVSAEAVIVGTEGTSKAEAKVITGQGKTIEEAFYELRKKTSQPLLLSHCGLLLLGEDINFEEVLEYAKKNKELTLSVFLGATDNAEQLLNLEAVSSIAIGYDLVGMIEQQEESEGENFKNRFYEIEASRKRGKNIKLPFFVIEKEEFSFLELREFRGMAK